ncbi:MAG TPA: M28 family peptidase [Sphingobium sp.]|uniref:M28 family peptidase n=1 Tax=Sphingobium sp. TaxID=1912891 RepID=UPI002ED46877
MVRTLLALLITTSAMSGAIAASLSAVPSVAPLPSVDAGVARFDRARISEDIRILASDRFEGRSVGTEGEQRTIAYIVERMKAIGLMPGGEIVAGRRQWTQRVPMLRSTLEGTVSAKVTTAKGTTPLTQGEQIAVRPPLNGSPQIALDSVPLVFAGYGIDAPEKKWNDFAGVDVAGKVVVVLVNDPDFESGSGDFDGRTMTYYGRYLYKFAEAARHGAAGVLVVHEDGPAGYGWSTVRTSSLAAATDVVRVDAGKAHSVLEGWIPRVQAAALFAAAGRDFETEKKAAQRRGFKGYDLGSTVSVSAGAKVEKIVSHNVLGRIPGTIRPDDVLMFSAHWDQDGIGDPDANGNRVSPGALDNASGVAMILELARVWRREGASPRSAVFMAPTAEERGMLGAEYYATHPVYPLERTAAVFNLDTSVGGGVARDFSIRGNPCNTLVTVFEEAGKPRGRYRSLDPLAPAGTMYRSDHFPFARLGVPALTYSFGEDLVEGGRARGAAWAAEYFKDRYHQRSDRWSPELNLESVAPDLDLIYAAARTVARSSDWPQWCLASEFAPVRASSDGLRQ